MGHHPVTKTIAVMMVIQLYNNSNVYPVYGAEFAKDVVSSLVMIAKELA